MAKAKKVEKAVEYDEKLTQLAYDQRIEMLKEVEQLLDRLGVGLSKYRENGWKFSPVDMEDSDPNNWKRAGRVALLLARLDVVRHDLWYQQSTKPLAPLWCVRCRGVDEYPGAPWLKVECREHDRSPALAASIAKSLWM